MGADLIATMLAVKCSSPENDIEAELDWEAGKEALSRIPYLEDDDIRPLVVTEFSYYTDYNYEDNPDKFCEQVGEKLEEDIDLLEERITGRDRSLFTFDFGPWVIFVCGGTSHGGSPSDLYDAINRVKIAGVDEVIGFSWPDRDISEL